MGKLKFFAFLLTAWSLTLTACSSKLVVTSNPPDVNLFARLPGSEEKKPLGKTPYEISQTDLQSLLKVSASSAQYVELIAEKEGMKTETLSVPLARLGHLSSEVYIKMRTGVEEAKLISTLLQFLFNAQRFANAKQFERALAEIDKALAIEPEFVNAITMKGSIFFLLSNYSESLKSYEQALKLDPKNEDAVKMISSLRDKLGNQP